MVFQRNLTEEDIHAFRDLPMATSTKILGNVGCEGRILYVDGCDVTMSIPPRNMQAGSCYDVSVGITTDHPPIREREFLACPGLDIALPAQWRYSTDQPVTLTFPHAASVAKSGTGRHVDIIWKERESTSVQRERSYNGRLTQCIITEREMKLSIYETSVIKDKVQLWIPVERHRQANGKRMVCSPFLPTDMASGEDITLMIYVHEDIPYFVQKIQKEEENRLYRQVHPGRCFVLEPELGDLVLECNRVKQIISPSELFNQHMKVFPLRVAKEPDTRTQMINISISSSNGKAKTSMAFMALQTGFSTGIGSTAEEIYSEPSTELSNNEEAVTAKINTDLYYHLGIALGLSYQTLDSIHFSIRQDKGSTSRGDGGRVTLNQKAATTMIRDWRELQDSMGKANDYLREVWKSVSDSEDLQPFIKQGRSANKNISKLPENEPGETSEDVFTESRHEEPLLAPSSHAHALEFQISSGRGHWEGRVHEKRVRTPSVRSDSLSSVSTVSMFPERGSLILIHDEAMGRQSIHKYKRTQSAVRLRNRAVRSILSIDEQHEHDEDPACTDSFAVEEHRKEDILAWMEAAEGQATVRPSDPSSKPRDDEEEMEGPAHPIYSQSPNLTQVQRIGHREDLNEDTGVIRLEKHDIEVRIPPDEAYGAKNVAWMERAAEGKPATFRPKGPSSEPTDKEEEMPSGPFHPIYPPNPEPPEQTQVQETENREDTSEDTGVIRLEKHGIEVRIPPDEACHAKDVTVTVTDEVPPELVLKETEAIISVGLKMSPSDAIFNSPVIVTIPHSGAFTKPEAAEIVIYHRKKATEEFTPIPSTSGTTRCVIRHRDLDLYMHLLSEIWIIAATTRVFTGKRVLCTPYIPVSTPMNEDHVLFVRIKDTNSRKEEVEDGYVAPISGEQFLVRWGSGSLRIICPESTMKTEARTIQESEIRHLTEHKVMFTVDRRTADMPKGILNFKLEQSTAKYLKVPMHLRDRCKSERDFDDTGGELKIPAHGLTLTIPPGSLRKGSDVRIAVEVLKDIPPGLTLRDDEILVTQGFQCLPSGLQFVAGRPASLKIPHCVNLIDPQKVQVVLYSWNHGNENGKPERIVPTSKSCRVTPHHIEIPLEHFSRGFLAFIKDWLYMNGKLMSFMPFLPRSMPPSRKVTLEFRMVKKPHGTSWKDIHVIGKDTQFKPVKDDDDEMNVKDEEMKVTCRLNNSSKIKKSFDVGHIQNKHTVYFPLDFNGTSDDRQVQLVFAQSECGKEIMFRTHFVPPGEVSDEADAAAELGASRRTAQSPAEKKAVSDADILTLSELLPLNLYHNFHVALGIDYATAGKIKGETPNITSQYIQFLRKWRAESHRTRADLDEILHQAEAGGLAKKYYSNTTPARTTSPMQSAYNSIEALGIDLTIINGGIVIIIVVMIAIMINNQHWF